MIFVMICDDFDDEFCCAMRKIKSMNCHIYINIVEVGAKCLTPSPLPYPYMVISVKDIK